MSDGIFILFGCMRVSSAYAPYASVLDNIVIRSGIARAYVFNKRIKIDKAFTSAHNSGYLSADCKLTYEILAYGGVFVHCFYFCETFIKCTHSCEL